MANFTKDEVVNKILSDPDAMLQSVMINPEAIGEFSPTLPNDFPKELIPLETCEPQLLKLVSCLLEENFDNVTCENHQYEFFQCKKWRDSLLFKRINLWEREYFHKMSDEVRPLYVQNLQDRKNDLISQYEKLSSTTRNRSIKKRIEADIVQLDWRVKYLNL